MIALASSLRFLSLSLSVLKSARSTRAREFLKDLSAFFFASKRRKEEKSNERREKKFLNFDA
jgi:hypothetical protein